MGAVRGPRAPSGWETAGSGGEHVVLLERRDHVAPQYPRENRHRDERNGEGGEQGVTEIFPPPAVRRPDPLGARQDRPPLHEYEDEQKSDQEPRNREQSEHHRGHGAVRARPCPIRLVRREGDRYDKGQQDRGDGDLGTHRKRSPDLGRNGLDRAAQRLAEVAGDHAAEPVDVPLQHRFVEPEPRLHIGQLVRRCRRAQVAERRVARREFEDAVGRERDEEQHGNQAEADGHRLIAANAASDGTQRGCHRCGHGVLSPE